MFKRDNVHARIWEGAGWGGGAREADMWVACTIHIYQVIVVYELPATSIIIEVALVLLL